MIDGVLVELPRELHDQRIWSITQLTTGTVGAVFQVMVEAALGSWIVYLWVPEEDYIVAIDETPIDDYEVALEDYAHLILDRDPTGAD